MSVLDSLRSLVTDPPPAWVFELSPAGIAYSAPSRPETAGFRRLDDGVLAVTPLADNVKNSEALVEALADAASTGSGGAAGSRSGEPVAVILPDYAARLQVLDFDTFPAKPEEQQALVRFRMKKTVPFDIETAAVSFYSQPPDGESKKVDVVAALITYEILGRYEASLREAGFQPGFVTTSALATLNLIGGDGLRLVAKLSGKTLTLLVLDGNRLKMTRCLELETLHEEALLEVLYPTLAYMEDTYGGSGKRPIRLLLCGFGADAALVAQRWQAELKISVELLGSRFGTPGPYNAGLLGYLEGAN